jgi:hypothetical protein
MIPKVAQISFYGFWKSLCTPIDDDKWFVSLQHATYGAYFEDANSLIGLENTANTI